MTIKNCTIVTNGSAAVSTTYPERTRDLAKLLMGIAHQALISPEFVAEFVQNSSEIPQLIEDANEAIRIIAEVYDFFPVQLENQLGMTEAVKKLEIGLDHKRRTRANSVTRDDHHNLNHSLSFLFKHNALVDVLDQGAFGNLVKEYNYESKNCSFYTCVTVMHSTRSRDQKLECG